mmetsp:Transcript_34294/g.74935  ORF Transcript_34294/g.74935 Transcript_34294/m.74935 type:complete len:244 (-) Transcript_34294:621-1352(-)
MYNHAQAVLTPFSCGPPLRATFPDYITSRSTPELDPEWLPAFATLAHTKRSLHRGSPYQNGNTLRNTGNQQPASCRRPILMHHPQQLAGSTPQLSCTVPARSGPALRQTSRRHARLRRARFLSRMLQWIEKCPKPLRCAGEPTVHGPKPTWSWLPPACRRSLAQGCRLAPAQPTSSQIPSAANGWLRWIVGLPPRLIPPGHIALLQSPIRAGKTPTPHPNAGLDRKRFQWPCETIPHRDPYAV